MIIPRALFGWSLLVALGVCGALQYPTLGNSTETSVIRLSVDASWRMTCKRSYVRQAVKVTNSSDVDLCFLPRICGSEMLLRIIDDRGEPVSYGFSCGRSEDPFRIQLTELRMLKPGDSLTFAYESYAAVVPLSDSPDEPLSPSRRYTGTTTVSVTTCHEVRAVCPGSKCRWDNVVLRTEKVTSIPIPFQGETCAAEPVH